MTLVAFLMGLLFIAGIECANKFLVEDEEA